MVIMVTKNIFGKRRGE